MNRFVALATLLLLGWLLYRLSPILTPFFVAAILAYLGNPLVSRLQKLGLGRGFATTAVFVLATLLGIGIVLALLPVIQSQFLLFLESVSKYLTLLQQNILPRLSARLGIPMDTGTLTGYAARNTQKLGEWAGRGLQLALHSGSSLITALLNIILIPVLTFYLLRDWPRLLARIRQLVPLRYLPLVSLLARDSDAMLTAFLRGQISVMLALGVTYAVGLSIIGLKTAILIGLLAGILSFVPYLGVISGVTMATLAIYVQTGQFLPILGVLVVFTVGQILESMVFTPYLVGDRIGLHPVAVIFAVLAGGELFGFIGLLLALPVTAVLIALLRHAHQWYLRSACYQGTPPPPDRAEP